MVLKIATTNDTNDRWGEETTTHKNTYDDKNNLMNPGHLKIKKKAELILPLFLLSKRSYKT